MDSLFKRDPVSAAERFFSLSKAKKRIILQLFYFHKKFKSIKPKVATLAFGSECCERTVQKFIRENKQLDNLFFEIEPVFEKVGGKWRQCQNKYIIEKNLLVALEWLDCYGFLNTKKMGVKRVISSLKQQFKMPPLPPQKVHPNYQRFFFIKDKDSEKLKTECFNPLLRGIKIDNSAKLLANKACDKEVYETLESCKWRESKGRVDNPSAYFCIVLRQKIMKNRGLRI